MIFLIIITAICIPSLLVLPFLISYITVRQESKVVPLSAGMALIWGIAGFCFKNPATDPDLVRYLSMLRNYFGKSLFESFNLQYENLFAVDIYFHFISKLGNPQFLPAISVFIFYFIIIIFTRAKIVKILAFFLTTLTLAAITLIAYNYSKYHTILQEEIP